MLNERQREELQEYLGQQILPLVGPAPQEWEPERLMTLQNRLRLMRHFCVRVGLEGAAPEALDSALTLSRELWQLLRDEAANRDSKSEYKRVRWLDLEASAIQEFEEVLSGEESLRDILINAVAASFNWRADTVWVDEAGKERIEMTESALVALQGHVWRLLDARAEREPDLALAEVTELGRSLDQLWHLMRSLGVEARMHLLIQIYAQFIRLELGRLQQILEAT